MAGEFPYEAVVEKVREKLPRCINCSGTGFNVDDHFGWVPEFEPPRSPNLRSEWL